MNRIACGKLAASLLTLLAAQSAWACQPPPLVPLNPAPAGPEGQLPLVKPVVRSTGWYDPKIHPCPVPSQYGDEAPLPSIGDSEYQVLFNGGTPLPGAWDSGKVYNTGDTASFAGQAWRAKWWNQGEQPGSNAWGAWEAVDSSTGPAEWSNSRAYAGGSQVVYAGLVYQARWWTQGDTPGTANGPWTLQVGVTPPSGLPQAFLANLYRRLANGTPQQYDLFINTALTRVNLPAPARWKVHVDGVEVASGSQFHQLVSDCPPPQNGAPACEANFAWSATATLPASAISSASRVTVWLCSAGNVCRPTPQLWARFGTYF
ncbi:carbohydrate-binding protein [Chitinolyticbacter meiyuanensis]|uniref:carbohydrate-binding protein n=1 Tax=Chitinolyticbacter meiyuanensis TaxID=682798 RepID=UPI001652268D|nr:carbohydrate-binding protein [Chitinolyticbacter meiyuanensis]